MGIFSSIMDKIFHSAATAVEGAVQAATTASAPQTAPAAATPASPALGNAAPAPASPSQPVDVEAVLTQMATAKGGGGNWQSSIVDLLKLLDLDSSLDARKQLANELSVHVAADGSAEENIAIHKAVMQKIAENGGKVPDRLKG